MKTRVSNKRLLFIGASLPMETPSLATVDKLNFAVVSEGRITIPQLSSLILFPLHYGLSSRI